MICKYRKKCKGFENTSATCTEPCDRNYCGKYRKFEKKKPKLNIFLFLIIGIFMIGIVSAIDTGLVAHYKMNDQYYNDTGNVIDSTGVNNGTGFGRVINHGTPSGGVTIEDGAMKFDGVDGRVVTTQNENLTNLTFSVWVKTNGYMATEFRQVAGKLLNYGLFYGSSNRYYADIKNNSGADFYVYYPKITLDSWEQYTMTVNGNNLSAYKNGIYIASNMFTGTINLSSGFFTMGNNAGTPYFNGSLDDVQIYNRSLSATEITAQYNLGRGKYALNNNGLVAQYSGRDYEGTTATPTKILDTNFKVEGKINQGIGFDGVNDYVNLSNSNSLNFTSTTNMTISTWVKMNNSVNQYIISKRAGSNSIEAGYSITYNTNKLRTYFGNGTDGIDILTNTNILNNQWHHLIWEYDGNTAYLYYDNVLINQSNKIITGGFGNSLNLFLSSYKGLSNFFNGSIDDVRIYNRSLSADEISYLYNSGLGTESDPSSIAYDNRTVFLVNNSVYNVTENANITFQSNQSTSNWFSWLIDGIERLAGLGQNVFNWVFNNTVSNPSSLVTSNVSSISYSTCFQETANVSTACGGLSTGSYSSYNIVFPSNFALMYDGSYLTGAAGGSPSNSTAIFYVNYTIPTNTNSITWRTRTPNQGLSGVNHTIYSNCSSGNVLVLKAETNTNSPTDDNVTWFCYGDSEWNIIHIDLGQNAIYEEAIYWNITNYNSISLETYNITTNSQNPNLSASLNQTILYAQGDKILLNTTATDVNLDKVWYSYNGTNTTIAGALTGVLNQTTITTNLSALQIIVYANDTVGNVNSTNVSFTLDAIAPTISLNYPTALIDYGKVNGTLQLNFTATDVNLDKVWYNYNGTNVYIAGATSGVYNQSNITIFNNTYSKDCYQENSNVSTSCGGLNTGAYSSGGNWNDGNWTTSYQKTDTVTEYLYVNYTIPSNYLGATWQSNMEDVRGDSYNYYNSSVFTECLQNNKLQIRMRLTRISSIPGSQSSISSTCWDYTTNDWKTGTVLRNSNIEFNNFNLYEEAIYWNLSNGKSVNIYANDTAGNLNTTTFSWDYKVFENSQSYINQTYAQVSNPFIVNITSQNISLFKLNYNGTNYSANTFTSGSNTIGTVNILAPIVSADTNISFYWIYTLLDGSTINSDSKNQTIKYIVLGNTYSNLIYNISVRDEFTNAIIPNNNVTMTYEVTYGFTNTSILATKSNFYDFNYSNKNISSNIFTSLYMSGNIIYSAPNYIGRTYNFLENYINSSKNITLYLTGDNISYVKAITVTDEAGRGQAATYKQYRVIGGVKTLVASETLSSTGKSTISFIPNVQYTFEFTKSGCDDLTNNIIFYDQSEYTQALSCTAYNPDDYIDPFEGMVATFSPNGVFNVNNATNTSASLFSVNISGTTSFCDSVSVISFNVYNQLGNVIVNDNSNSCDILFGSGLFNNFATGSVYILLNSGEEKTLTFKWIKLYSDADYANYSMLTLISEVGNSDDILGIDWKFKILISFIGLLGIIIALTIYQRIYNFSNLPILIVADIYIWFMCFIGWGDLNIGATGGGITALVSKYALLILAVIASAGIIATKEDEYS